MIILHLIFTLNIFVNLSHTGHFKINVGEGNVAFPVPRFGLLFVFLALQTIVVVLSQTGRGL